MTQDTPTPLTQDETPLRKWIWRTFSDSARVRRGVGVGH